MSGKPLTILDPHFRRADIIFSDHDLARVEDAVEIIWGRDEPMPDEAVERVREDVELIITGGWRYGDVARFPRLRAILEVAGGFPRPDVLDYERCFARSIRVLSCAPAFGPAVAEMGLALALASARQVTWTDAAFRAGEPNWSHTEFATEIGEPFTLYGKTVGMIGFGGLARALKPLLEPWGCTFLAYDPWLTDASLRSQGVTPVDLETLLATSRIIFVLAVPSSGNRAMLDRARLEMIRPDAALILLSRAHVVDFDALTEMILAGRFRAGIDVFPEEPLPVDHPIRRAPHAVLSSHRAGAIREGLRNVGTIVADDVESLAAGLVPRTMQVAQPEFIRMRG